MSGYDSRRTRRIDSQIKFIISNIGKFYFKFESIKTRLSDETNIADKNNYLFGNKK